jgi:hypothetical protein
MYEIITQPIYAGYYRPEEQVEFAVEAVLTAAQYLEFVAIDELETALSQMRPHLVLLAAAGLFADFTFSQQDDQCVCGVQVTISPYLVATYEKVDLSRLRLLANPEACASIEVWCREYVFAQEITGANWLPDTSAVLSCNMVSWGTPDDQMEH